MAAWLAVVVIACLILGCTCVTLVVDNPYHQIPANGTSQFMCQADVPLVGCQVNSLTSGTVFDLSAGGGATNYWGSGLENGQCGFTVTYTWGLGWYYPFGCRVRARDGDWQYGTSVLSSTDLATTSELPVVQAGPSRVLVDSGSSVDFAFAAGEALSQCSFKWPGQTTWKSSGSTNAYSIDNSKLTEGRCKLTLLNVQSDTSGIVTSEIISNFIGGKEQRVFKLTTLVVKKAPGAPALSLSKADGVYTEGDVMEASCHFGPARPLARVTWLLNADVIQGVPEEFSAMPWEFEAGDVTRKLRRKLSLADDGKELVCRVHHVALRRGVVEARTKVKVLQESGNSQEIITDVNTSILSEKPDRSAKEAKLPNCTLCSHYAWNILGSRVFPIIVAVIVGALFGCSITGGVIFWLRRNPDSLATVPRPSYQTENPYDELTIAPSVSQPPIAPSARQSAIYGNTVQYLEVIVGPSAGSKPPPRKPVVPETCVYAEVMHKDRPKH